MLRVSVLGGLRLDGPAGSVPEGAVEGAQARVVVAFLAATAQRTASRDELAEALWPDGLPDTWEVSIRNAVSRARRAFVAAGAMGEVITSSGGAYRLVVPDLSVDLEDLDALVDQAEAALQADEHTLAGNLADQAVAMLQHQVLPGWTGEWVDERRRGLERARVTAGEVGAEAALAGGQPVAALAHADAALRVEPFRERAHRAAMRAHMVAGSRGEALKAYERCRRVLDDELGVRPSPETEALYVELLGDEPDGARETVPADRAVRSSVLPMPVQVRGVFAGRQAELDVLDRGMDRALAGDGHVVFVSGPPGIGKTSVVLRAASAAHERGVTVLYGRCSEDAVIPFEPFVEAFERALEAVPLDEQRTLLATSGPAILRLLPAIAARLPDLQALSSTDPDADRALVLSGVVTLLRALSPGPAVLIIDDLQWAAEPVLLLVRHLVHATRHDPVCVVMTHRPEELDDAGRSTIDTLARGTGISTVELDGLTLDDITLMVEDRDVDPATVFERSGGHPLFASALLDEPIEELAATVPGTIASVVGRQVRRLDDRTRKALGVISVIGLEVDLELLQQVTGVSDEHAVAIVEELAQAGLVVATSQPGVYQVRHSVVRDAIYEALEPARRAVLHNVVGESLESTGRSSSAADLGRLAHHFGASVSTHRRKAIAYAGAAGDQAMAMAAFEDAARHFGDVLRWLPAAHDTSERVDAMVRLGDAHRRAGVAEGAEVLVEAGALARRLGYVDGMVDAALANGRRGLLRRGRRTERQHLDPLLDALDAIGPETSPRRVRLLAQVAIELAWSDDNVQLPGAGDEAVAVARRIGDIELLATALTARHIAVRVPSAYEQRLEDFLELQDLLQELRDPYWVATACYWGIRTCFERGRLDDARSLLDQGTRVAEGLNDRVLRWMLSGSRTNMRVLSGDLHDVEADLERFAELGRASGEPDAELQHHAASMGVQLFRDPPSVDEARWTAQREVADSAWTSPIYISVAYLCLDAGRREEGEAMAATCDVDYINALPVDRGWLMTLSMIARCAGELGRREEVELVSQLLEPFRDHLIEAANFPLGAVRHALGVAAMGISDLAAADQHLLAAQARGPEVGPVHLAEVTKDLARLRVAQGDLDAAVRLAEEAVSLGERTGATAVVRRARVVLAECATRR